MSQVTETELPSLIYQYLDLKLDKDDFIKPSRKVVTQIYKRFLDKIDDTWALLDQPEIEASEWALMLRALEVKFASFNEFEFNLSDIIEPTRKRTLYFLNVVLFIIAQWELLNEKCDQLEASLQERQKDSIESKQRLEYLRRERDEWAVKIGMREPVNEDLIAKLEREIEALRDQGDQLAEVNKRLNEEQEKLAEANKIDLDERRRIYAEIETTRRCIKLDKENKLLEDELKVLSQDINNFEYKNAIERNEYEAQMEQIKLNNLKDKQESDAKIQAVKPEIDKINKEREEIPRRKDIRAVKSQAIKERVERKNKELTVKAERLQRISQKGEEALVNYTTQINSLLGVNQPKMIVECDVNRTYIKTST